MFVHESLVEVLVEVLAELPSPACKCIVIGIPVPARETRVARASGFTSGCDDPTGSFRKMGKTATESRNSTGHYCVEKKQKNYF